MLERVLLRVVLLQVVDDRADEGRLGLDAFEPIQTGVDALPARTHQVDEQREIVDAGMALRQQLALEPLEAPNCLIQQTADLGDVARDGEDLSPKPVANGGSDACRNRRLELGRGCGECLDLIA